MRQFYRSSLSIELYLHKANPQNKLRLPFSFTKGYQTMRLEGYNWADPVPFGTLLFDLESDPYQKEPITDSEIEAMMIQHLVRLMEENDTPEEQFERLRLVG